MLKTLFMGLINNKNIFFWNIKRWEDFEKKIEHYMIDNIWMVKIWKQYISDLKYLKSIVTNKLNDQEYIINDKWKELNNSFISQPFWSQSYPDFLIFTKDKIIPLEIKMATNKDNIMWNSWFPVNSGIYIYLNINKQDITFFKWSDILTNNERRIMIDFFEGLKGLEKKVNKELEIYDVNGTWFQVYIRKAFLQKKTNDNIILSFFDNPKRKQREDNVLNMF